MGKIMFSGPDAKAAFKAEKEWRETIGTLKSANEETMTIEYEEVVNPYPETLKNNFRGD